MGLAELNTIEEMKNLIDTVEVKKTVESLQVTETPGRVLAEDLKARDPLPRFDQSAMDGYAVQASDLVSAGVESPVELKLKNEVAAGDDPKFELNPGETARIFTGAPVPSGADAVVIQEKVEGSSGRVQFFEPVEAGANIRYRGGEIEPGKTLLSAGQPLSPPGVGLALSQGVEMVKVYRRPSAAVLSTGEELVPPTTEPGPGEKRDSSNITLVKELEPLVDEVDSKRVGDRPAKIKTILSNYLDNYDVVFTLGGVSVGEKDYVPGVLEELGVEKLAHGVFQKPGKPLWFGRRGETFVFGLPGNPVSSLACFYLYAYNLLRRIAGYESKYAGLREGVTRLDSRFDKETARSRLAWARTWSKNHDLRSRLLDCQESHMLTGPAKADSLVYLPGNRESIGTDEPLRVYFLPW